MRRPRRRLGDERGSLPLLMMVILVGMVLSSLMVSVLVSSTHTTRFTTSREQALDAAQAGIDVVLARIRASTDVSGAGSLAALPCWTHRNATPYSGSVVSDPGGSRVGTSSYSVYVDYYVEDPVLKPSSTAMLCSPGYGTFDPGTGQSAPWYGLITSTGTVDNPTGDTTSGRTLVSTYVFRLTNVNIAGGIFRLYPAAGALTNVCLDAGTGAPDPSTTTPVSLQACSTSTPPLAQQVFAYRKDLTIQLLSSVTVTNAAGLCLDSIAPLANNNPVYLKRCNAVGTPPPYQQQWSFDDNGHLRGSLSTSSSSPGTLSSICVAAASQSPGQAVRAATCAGGVDDPTQSWIPAPSVGAGKADEPQYVNFLEFGRCLDVTAQNVNAAHQIAYPCKQNPYSGAVTWNQKFSYTALTTTYGQLTTTTGGSTYCLTSPRSDGGYPTLTTPCVTGTGSTALAQRWVRSGASASVPYSARFTLVDQAGLCLGLTAPVGTEVWSAVDVETCTGSLDQKWNADPNLSSPTLQNTLEK